MKPGIYEINKKTLNDIENKFVFDFKVDFNEFDTVTIEIDTIEFYKEESAKVVWTEFDREYIVQPSKRVLYKRNDVSGCYCRVI